VIARALAAAADPEIRDSLHEALTDSDGVGIAMCDRDLRYVFWNRFMEEMTGLSAAEVLGKNALEMYPHARDGRMEAVLERVLGGESVSLPDQRYTVPGVRTGWVWVQYQPHRGPDGSVTGVVGIVHDAERKRCSLGSLPCGQGDNLLRPDCADIFDPFRTPLVPIGELRHWGPG
jgi:PAS domain S-box-containing protein